MDTINAIIAMLTRASVTPHIPDRGHEKLYMINGKQYNDPAEFYRVIRENAPKHANAMVD
jgi:hypothetical protein